MQPENTKHVGIIGAGRLGQAMARIGRRAGRPVVISNREGPESLASLVRNSATGCRLGRSTKLWARTSSCSR